MRNSRAQPSKLRKPMSEMNPCNYCQHKWLVKIAREQGMILTKVGDTFYKHPAGINIRDLPHGDRDDYFAAWYMELPKECHCD